MIVESSRECDQSIVGNYVVVAVVGANWGVGMKVEGREKRFCLGEDVSLLDHGFDGTTDAAKLLRPRMKEVYHQPPLFSLHISYITHILLACSRRLYGPICMTKSVIPTITLLLKRMAAETVLEVAYLETINSASSSLHTKEGI